MKVTVIAVGKPHRLLATAIAEYEERASRYWSLDVVEVRGVKGGRGQTAVDVRRMEANRLAQRVPTGSEIVLLTRQGEHWSSENLAAYLGDLAVRGKPGVAFLIGGATGVDESELAGVNRRMALSSMTLPHELARLVLAEQLYRAGTIVRGEPYHKGAPSGP